jgi:SulP family sulfate permease
LWKNNRNEFYILVFTFCITLFVGIKEGIMLGVFVALLYMIYQNTQPHIAVLGRIKDTHYFKNIDRFTKDVVTYPQVLILRFDGPLFFGNQRYFKQAFSALIEAQELPTKHLVIAAAPISYIDATAFEMLSIWMEELNTQGIAIHWTGLNGPLRDRFHKKRVFDPSHKTSIYSSLDAALNAIQGSAPSEIEKSIASQRNKI